MKISTKTGDLGETSLYGGKRVSKDNLQLDAYGTIDELNSAIGMAIAEIGQVDIRHFLKALQNDLLSIGSYLAGNHQEKLNLELRVSEIEKVIDEIDKKLPKLTNFILPGGGKLGAALHLVRTIARRTERSVIRFFNTEAAKGFAEDNKKKVIAYLNRISDFLFELARFANLEEGISEEIWKAKIT